MTNCRVKGFIYYWYISESTLMLPRDSNQLVALWSLSFVGCLLCQGRSADHIDCPCGGVGHRSRWGCGAIGWIPKFLTPSIVNLARHLAVSPVGSRTDPRTATDSRTHREWGTNFWSQRFLGQKEKRGVADVQNSSNNFWVHIMSTRSTFLSMIWNICGWQVVELMLAQDDTTSWLWIAQISRVHGTSTLAAPVQCEAARLGSSWHQKQQQTQSSCQRRQLGKL